MGSVFVGGRKRNKRHGKQHKTQHSTGILCFGGLPKRLQSRPLVANPVAMDCVFVRARKRNKRQHKHNKTQIRTGILCFNGLKATSKASPRGSGVAPLWSILSPWALFAEEGGRKANEKETTIKRNSALVSCVSVASTAQVS